MRGIFDYFMKLSLRLFSFVTQDCVDFTCVIFTVVYMSFHSLKIWVHCNTQEVHKILRVYTEKHDLPIIIFFGVMLGQHILLKKKTFS
jgi:hypothetical protein